MVLVGASCQCGCGGVVVFYVSRNEVLGCWGVLAWFFPLVGVGYWDVGFFGRPGALQM